MNGEKSALLVKEVTYMGYVVDSEGTRLKDRTIEKIRDAELPTSLTELKSFQGLMEWGREFASSGEFATDMGILASALEEKESILLVGRGERSLLPIE